MKIFFNFQKKIKEEVIKEDLPTLSVSVCE